MSRSSHFVPTHRDTSQPQPEVCQLCGTLVPSSGLSISDVEGLRGAAICSTHKWEAKARFTPSYNDLQVGQPAPNVPDNQRTTTSGDKLWFREGG